MKFQLKTPEVKYQENFTEFKEFLDRFTERNGGYIPSVPQRWFNAVQVSHEPLRTFLGGTKRERFINLKSQQSPVKEQDIEHIINGILAIIPGYLSQYGYDRSIFCLPSIQQGSHNSTKVSKHIRTYAEAKLRDQVIAGSKLTVQLKELDKLLSQLGEAWARAKTSDITLEVTLSTTAKGFTLLGHYGPDKDSCFRNGSDKTMDKFVLGQTKHTFVITIAKEDQKKQKYKNVARAFGFFSESLKTFNICNPYLEPGFLEGDMIETLRILIEDLWDKKSEFAENKIILDNRGRKEYGIFQNPYGNWTFTQAGEYPSEKESILYPDSNFIKLFMCPMCGGSGGGRDRGWEYVDEYYVCPTCVGKSHQCDLSGARTNKTLINALGEGGKVIEVHPDLVEQLTRCEECDIPHLESVFLEGRHICEECVDLNYVECDCCHETVKENEIHQYSTSSICNKCNALGEFPFDEEEVIEVLKTFGVGEDSFQLEEV